PQEPPQAGGRRVSRVRTDRVGLAADLRRDDREPPRRGPPGLRARRDPRLRAEHHRRLSVLRADRAAARAARRGSAGPRLELDPTGAVRHTRSSWLMANG